LFWQEIIPSFNDCDVRLYSRNHDILLYFDINNGHLSGPEIHSCRWRYS